MNQMRNLMETLSRIDEEIGWDYDQVSISELKGKVFTSVEGKQGGDQIVFKVSPRTSNEPDEEYIMAHRQDCCESVWIEEIIGDLNDLVGSEILEAEEVSNKSEPPPERYQPDPDDEWAYGPESYTWTFYKLGTMKGHVTIRWYGSSNGYYSERAGLYKKEEYDDETI
jgi:hypothetical protein